MQPRLRDYLQGLSDGTVLVGISCDEASRYLSAAESTLTGLGADVTDVGFRGAWAFLTEVGDTSSTILDKELTQSSALGRDPIITQSFGGAYYDLLYGTVEAASVNEFIMPVAFCKRLSPSSNQYTLLVFSELL